jgi:hypothetical protein
MKNKNLEKDELTKIYLTHIDQALIARLTLQEFDDAMSFVSNSVKEKFQDDKTIVFISKLDRDELARVFVFCKYLHELFCKISVNVTSEQLEVKQSMDEVKEKMSAGLGMCELILNAQSEISLDK